MAKQNTPFRYDYVGSFLRPEALKVARSKYEAGTITKEELTSVEDQEIRALVEKQKAAGYKVLTDGEFRLVILREGMSDLMIDCYLHLVMLYYSG